MRQARGLQSYGSRRGNHEVMVRGNLRHVCACATSWSRAEGGFTRHLRAPADGDLDASRSTSMMGTAAVPPSGGHGTTAQVVPGLGSERARRLPAVARGIVPERTSAFTVRIGRMGVLLAAISCGEQNGGRRSS